LALEELLSEFSGSAVAAVEKNDSMSVLFSGSSNVTMIVLLRCWLRVQLNSVIEGRAMAVGK
jgi:hypothetical protein